jgi:hypothetical protein
MVPVSERLVTLHCTTTVRDCQRFPSARIMEPFAVIEAAACITPSHPSHPRPAAFSLHMRITWPCMLRCTIRLLALGMSIAVACRLIVCSAQMF